MLHSPRETADSGLRKGHPAAGAMAVFLGLGVWLLMLIDIAYGLPFDMPRSWYVNRAVWGAVGLALFGLGWKLQRQPATGAREWRPVPGRRFHRLVVFSRADCHLCDDAKAVLADYLEFLPEIEEIDIDDDPELKQLYGTSIPVVELDGQIRFRGRIDVILLRRLIEGTPVIVAAD